MAEADRKPKRWRKILALSLIGLGLLLVMVVGGAWYVARSELRPFIEQRLSQRLDRRVTIHTPLMWVDKAGTFAMAREIAGQAFLDLIVEETHTCYLGDRSHHHPWGYGCGACPACELRAQGYAKFCADGPA